MGHRLWVSDVEHLPGYGRYDRKKESLNGLYHPPCVHICVTLRHTQAGVAERFSADLKAAVEYVKRNPDERSGTSPVYGTVATIPFKGIVDDMLKRYLDMLYQV